MNFLFLKYNFCLFFSRLLSYLSKPFQLPVWYGVYVHHCYSLYAQDISVQVQYCTQYSLCTPLPFSVYSRYISSLTVLYTIQFLYTIAIRFMLKMYQFRYSTVHNTKYLHHFFSLGFWPTQLADCLIDDWWLSDWVIEWLTDWWLMIDDWWLMIDDWWLIDCLIVWLIDWLFVWLIDLLIDWLLDWFLLSGILILMQMRTLPSEF